MKIDAEKIKEKLLKIKASFDKEAVIYLVLLLAILIYGVFRFLVPGISSLAKNIEEYLKKSESVENMEKRFAARALESKNSINKKALAIKIYKIPYKNMELEDAAAELINEIISIINKNGENQISALEFEKKPLTDRMGVESKNHNILSLKLELVSSYDVVQNILNDVFLMDYMARIHTVSLTGLEQYNFKKVQVYLVLDLLVETSEDATL
ncbi:MAG TPA: hypothetical protein P5556_05720 [Candidatus Gastranaerophilales bacterium]|nr:hypothetical protein [Candidatus Gastranaerophilales bacterium]